MAATAGELRAAARRLLEAGEHSGVLPSFVYERRVREEGVLVARALLALLQAPKSQPPSK